MAERMRGNKRHNTPHSPATIEKMRAIKTGKRNPNWRGGFAATSRNCSKWLEFRATIVARDNGICQSCGAPGNSVHHKIPERVAPQLVYEADNCVTLCDSCHKKADDAYRRAEDNQGEHT